MTTEIREIEVTINGQKRQVGAGQTIVELLDELGLHPKMVVVEHNYEILDRDVLGSTEVRAGDNLELVHFVGGG